jgi:type IV pilus assembly protein PilW
MRRSGHPRAAAPRHAEGGFTLVEVLSALAILAIAMTAVFATFSSQQKSFTVQNRVVELQQNLRQAAEYMARDLRLAGYGLPRLPTTVAIPNNVIAPGVTTMRSLFARDGGAAAPDDIYILYLYDMDANQPPTTNTNPIPVNAGAATVAGTTGFLPSGGELVLVTDGTTADLFETSAAGGGVLTFAGGYNYNAVPHAGYGTGPPPATVAKARFVRYYIDNTTDPAHPTLMVDRLAGAGQPPQPLADDIEDLQIQYHMDTDNDGITETFNVNDPAVGVSPVTGIALNPSQVRQIRLQLLARTRVLDPSWSETRQGLANRSGGTSADGYRRRIVDVVIDVRNSGV